MNMRGPLYSGLSIVTNPYLTETETETRPLSLLDKFFLFVERLCSEAEIYYYWRVVPSKKAVIIGNTIYIHPAMLISLKAKLKEFEAI